MCLTCGCGEDTDVRVLSLDDHTGHEHQHGDGPGQHRHDHAHGAGHDHALLSEVEHDALHAGTQTVAIEEAILAKNDHLAEHNRAWLADRGITALNLMSSPGSGKTSLLERTIVELSSERSICVIEGDQETTFDADRIRRAGARAVQVNTGAGCHLDAPMVQRAIEALDPEPGSLLFIENVGNLVCPALFDIGEQAKVVIISVTEGHDKPLKYPHMFSAADLVIVNKTDLLPYVDFDVEVFAEYARRLSPDIQILPLSARTGEQIDTWYGWLSRR
jgi:hydrogenase nickel incorporation protein HypB